MRDCRRRLDAARRGGGDDRPRRRGRDHAAGGDFHHHGCGRPGAIECRRRPARHGSRSSEHHSHRSATDLHALLRRERIRDRKSRAARPGSRMAAPTGKSRSVAAPSRTAANGQCWEARYFALGSRGTTRGSSRRKRSSRGRRRAYPWPRIWNRRTASIGCTSMRTFSSRLSWIQRIRMPSTRKKLATATATGTTPAAQ